MPCKCLLSAAAQPRLLVSYSMLAVKTSGIGKTRAKQPILVRWNTLELRFLQATTAADGYAHWAVVQSAHKALSVSSSPQQQSDVGQRFTSSTTG